MSIYKVTEVLIEIDKKEGEGYYSSLDKARNAVLRRVAEVYTEEEMEHFKFEYSDGGYKYETFGNKDIFDCVYWIDEILVDEPIMD